MASETVPAATPGPNDPAPTAPTPTGLAGILAPVQPARTGTTAAFTLDPATGAEAGQETVGSGASSAAYHTTSTGPENPTSARSSGSSGGAGAGKEGVFKTILRAAAERWRKGADIHVKRLEMQKARYQAAQVKETRQVVVNRTPGSNSGGRSGSGMGGKQGGGKANASGLGGGQPKNSSGSPQGSGKASGSRNATAGSGGGRSTSGNTGKDSTGSSGSSGRGTRGGNTASGSGGSGAGAGDSRSGSGGTKRPHTGTGAVKEPAGAGRSSGGGSGKSGSKDSSTGSSTGKSGSDGKQGKDGRPGNSSSAGKTASADGSRDERPWKKDRHHGKTTDGDSPKNTPATAGTADAAKGSKTGKDTGQGTGTGHKPATPDKKPGTPDKTGTAPKQPNTPPTTGAGKGKPLDVQPSREAGYRDGTSAGRVIAHMGAYRDGVRDGYHDTQEAAKRERQRLDHARDDRKKQRTTEPKGPDVSATTSADHHPQPLPVAQVTASHVVLGNGQSRTRGEVRTLKQYERRLEQKAMAMHRVADATKKLQAHAEEQAKKAATLLEQAKAIKGGEKVTGILVRLHDKATQQARLAQNVNRRAAKAAENASVVLANVRTRYGPIYQAVVDSPETKPAELRFYRDGGTTHG